MQEEPTYAREYVHVASAGNGVECEVVSDSVCEYLLRWYDDKKIRGYNLIILHNDEECEEKLVHDDWKRIIGDVFPVVRLLVQPFPAPAIMDSEVEEYLLSVGFARVR